MKVRTEVLTKVVSTERVLCRTCGELKTEGAPRVAARQHAKELDHVVTVQSMEEIHYWRSEL